MTTAIRFLDLTIIWLGLGLAVLFAGLLLIAAAVRRRAS